MSQSGSPIILVIDDNSAVLSMTNAMLIRCGYVSIASLSGKQAIDLLEGFPEVEVHLALIDVILADMRGTEVADQIRRTRPGLPIIFMTGFPEHREFLEAQGEPVLRKPFTSVTLAQSIRERLDRPAKSSSAAGRI